MSVGDRAMLSNSSKVSSHDIDSWMLSVPTPNGLTLLSFMEASKITEVRKKFCPNIRNRLQISGDIKYTINQFEECLPYSELFLRMNDKDLNHIKKVVQNMNNLLSNRFDLVLNVSDSGDGINPKSKAYKILRKIVSKLNEENKCLLICTALYHDVGKAILKPRHGPEGADIIKDSDLKKENNFVIWGLSVRTSTLCRI